MSLLSKVRVFTLLFIVAITMTLEKLGSLSESVKNFNVSPVIVSGKLQRRIQLALTSTPITGESMYYYHRELHTHKGNDSVRHRKRSAFPVK